MHARGDKVLLWWQAGEGDGRADSDQQCMLLMARSCCSIVTCCGACMRADLLRQPGQADLNLGVLLSPDSCSLAPGCKGSDGCAVVQAVQGYPHHAALVRCLGSKQHPGMEGAEEGGCAPPLQKHRCSLSAGRKACVHWPTLVPWQAVIRRQCLAGNRRTGITVRRRKQGSGCKGSSWATCSARQGSRSLQALQS